MGLILCKINQKKMSETSLLIDKVVLTHQHIQEIQSLNTESEEKGLTTVQRIMVTYCNDDHSTVSELCPQNLLDDLVSSEVN